MIQRLIVLSMMFMVTSVTQATPISYVKICSLFGHGYFYIPGTDRCLNPETGLVIYATEFGVVHTQSDLARRVQNLEAEFKIVEDAIDLYYPQ